MTMTIKSLGEKLSDALDAGAGLSGRIWPALADHRQAELERAGLAFAASLSHDETATATIAALTARAVAAEQARDEAREALKPFAEAAETIPEQDDDAEGVEYDMMRLRYVAPSAGAFRQAAKIINPAKEG
jgi:hypothetical protein